MNFIYYEDKNKKRETEFVPPFLIRIILAFLIFHLFLIIISKQILRYYSYNYFVSITVCELSTAS